MSADTSPPSGARWARHQAESLVAHVFDQGAARLRWLDVACGRGEVVGAALDAGVERIDAVDPDVDNVAAVGAHFDRAIVGVRVGELTDLGGFAGPYDVVLSTSAMERSDDPATTLRAMREVLTYDSVAWTAVWDLDDERSPLHHFWEAVDDVTTTSAPSRPVIGTHEQLAQAVKAAGWTGDVGRIEVTMPVTDAEDLWDGLQRGATGAWLAGQSKPVWSTIRDRVIEAVLGGDGGGDLTVATLAASTQP